MGGKPKGERYGGVIIFTSGSSRIQRTSRLLDSFSIRGRIVIESNSDYLWDGFKILVLRYIL